jgi:hypothetical protein
MALTEIPIELSSTPGIVDNSNATAITIDSSENVLVGKTSLAIANEGIVFEKGGAAEFTTDAARVMRLNRTSDDGSVLEINKDGTTVGSIQSRAGLVSTIILDPRTNGVGLTGTATAVIPTNNTGVLSNAAMDIGGSGYAFKDLYLSGGAYLGGTGAANKLEDYEEGTWTPTDGSGASLTLGATNNRYTKVGRLVVASVRLTFPTTSSTATAQVVLPFTVDSNAISSVSGGVCTEQNYDSDITLTASINDNTRVIFRKRGASGLTNANLSGKILRFTVTYHAA